MTVLGEAISNSWDADAENVWIYIDRKNGSMLIKDDGIGMDSSDFQSKFLKIGYSKRKHGQIHSVKGRSYIGRKGIGKLAMLSCAKTVSVISRKSGEQYIGGKIDNSRLDEAITDDLTPQEYPLEDIEMENFDKFLVNHNHGTIIYFEEIKDGIKSSIEYLKKSIALYFRFSLLDDSFNIFLEDDKILLDHLKDLAEKTQFIWIINDLHDPFITDNLTTPPLKRSPKSLKIDSSVKGFIASVDKPRDLKIISTEDRVSIDLFVNGRLRERDILKHIPTARLVENYLYGQIHYDELEGDVDRFTSSRESVVSNDPKFTDLLELISKKILPQIIDDWDEWRIEQRQSGDPENLRITKKERTSRELFTAILEEYVIPDSDNRKKVNNWVGELEDDAQFNFTSYAECFVSENLIREYIRDNAISISSEAQKEAEVWKNREVDNKNKGNVSIDIRHKNDDLSYLSMDDLANMVDKGDPIKEASLARNAKEYKPIRDAIAHTSRLTSIAKLRLTTVYENIKARVIELLSGK